MFDKLRRKIHNLRPSAREEKIKLKAKQEILATISNTVNEDDRYRKIENYESM